MVQQGKGLSAEQLMAATAHRLAALRSLEAEATIQITMQMPDGPQRIDGKGVLALERPALAQITLTGGMGKLYVSDGTLVWRLFPEGDPGMANRYSQSPLAADGTNVIGLPLHPAHYFFRVKDLWPGPKDARLRVVGSERWNGQLCAIVERSQMGGKLVERFFLTPDRLLVRVVMTMSVGAGQTIDSRLTRVRLNPTLDPKRFVFPLTPPLRPLANPESGARLLAVGASAPEFTLPTPDGQNLSLAQLRARNKAVLVNFWYYNCGPCQAEMPQFQRLYTALREQGFALVAVDNNDSARTLRLYATKNRLTFPIVLGQPSTFTDYGVVSYPTSYLIGADGKVLWRGVGYDPSGRQLGLKAALEQAGFSLTAGVFG